MPQTFLSVQEYNLNDYVANEPLKLMAYLLNWIVMKLRVFLFRSRIWFYKIVSINTFYYCQFISFHSLKRVLSEVFSGQVFTNSGEVCGIFLKRHFSSIVTYLNEHMDFWKPEYLNKR